MAVVLTPPGYFPMRNQASKPPDDEGGVKATALQGIGYDASGVADGTGVVGFGFLLAENQKRQSEDWRFREMRLPAGRQSR